MQTIKFSHYYKKMPDLGVGIEYLETWIKEVAVVEYEHLTAAEIKEDTETTGGEFYELPKTRLIKISLWSDTINGGKSWATMRRWTPQKYQYYKGLVGQQVKIVIEK